MKVRCIKDATYENGEPTKCFTKGKEYTIHMRYDVLKGWCVTNDLNEDHWIHHPESQWFDEHFEVVK